MISNVSSSVIALVKLFFGDLDNLTCEEWLVVYLPAPAAIPPTRTPKTPVADGGKPEESTANKQTPVQDSDQDHSGKSYIRELSVKLQTTK